MPISKPIVIAGVEQTPDALRLSLGPEWNVLVAGSGTEALAAMKEQPPAVVVASLDLPGIDGAELLNQVRKKYPKAVRFVLAEEIDRERVMKRVLGAHQFLAKPLDCSVLKDAMERTMAIEGWILNDNLRALVARVRSFPTVPSLYLEVLALLRSPNATTEEVGHLIAKDLAMMTKLLQVLNSAYFGLPRRITDPAEAVGILGFETVKSLVMAVKLLSQYDRIKPVHFSLEALWQHSTGVAQAAKGLALLHTGDRSLAANAFTGGLMHDLGKVVLAANFDEQYAGAHSLARKQNLPLWEVEREIFGATHGEIGAYLFGLWGMPLELLEVAAFHHDPSRGRSKEFSALAAVHVGNALEHEINPGEDGLIAAKLDTDYLTKSGLINHLELWREAVKTQDFSLRAPSAAPEKATDQVQVAQAPEPVVAETVYVPPELPPDLPPSSESPLPVACLPFEESPRRQRKETWLYLGAAAAGLLMVLSWVVLSQIDKQTALTSVRARSKSFPVVSVPSAPTSETDLSTSGTNGSGVSTLGEDTSPPDPSLFSNDLFQVVSSLPETGTPVASVTGSTSPSTLEKEGSEGRTPLSPLPAAVSNEPVFPELKLQGVFFSIQRPSAIINGRLVFQNERIAGAAVLQIGRSNVVVEYQNQRKTLSLK